MEKSASRNLKPRDNRKPKSNKRPTQVKIFISYAKEDNDLAASVHAELLQLFTFAPVDIFRDVGIPEGSNYQATMDTKLDDADILIVLLTDRMKPSYSYTGYEIGFFRHSILNRPKIYLDIDRVVIPVCIGADNPEALHYVQSIQIDTDKIFKINDANTKVENDQNPAATLLKSISDIVVNILGISHSPSQDARLTNSASRLYSLFREYLQGRVSSETFPERKIIIRTNAPPAMSSNGVDLAASTIELVGDSFQAFGFPEERNRQFTWEDFNAKMPDDMGGTWAEGIKALVTAALHSSDENYHVVSTAKGDKAFRLFVSRIVTFVSKKTEIHIYIVQMVVRHYGDQITSRLLSAISIGLQFRFLFLEEKSKFKPENFEVPKAPQVSEELDYWKRDVRELMSQLDLVLRDAQEAHLMDPDLLYKIWGAGTGPQLQEMMGTWQAAYDKLYLAAQQLLIASSSDFATKRQPFIEGLRSLRTATRAMNQQYTLRALHAVAEEIGGSYDGLSGMPLIPDGQGAKSQPAAGSAPTPSA
jgi:TIR domain